MILIPKNWAEFQHYKDRNPPWIRLHKKLLDNKDFNALPPMACKVLILLWLVASDTTEGEITDNVDELAFRLRMPVKDVQQALAILIKKDFLVEAGGEPAPIDGRPLSKVIAEGNGFGSRHISDNTKRLVWERDGGKCCACGAVEAIEYDHIHPVSKGGNSNIENLQLLCRPCNRKKRSKTAEQVATPAQPWLNIRTSETETETETETEKPSATAPAIPPALLKDFLKVRKAKKGGELTPTALAGIQREADKAGLTLEQAVTACCEYSWVGFNAQWYADRNAPKQSGYAKPAQNATVPGKAERDPELTRLDIERARAVPMPASVREAMAKLKQGVAA